MKFSFRLQVDPDVMNRLALFLNQLRQRNFTVGDEIIYENGYIITWILHQIFMFSNKVKQTAGLSPNPPPLPHPHPLNERTDQ